MAAYRRRRQGVAEKMPRWDGPRGRLRLSRLPAFEREQVARVAWKKQLDEWRELDAQRAARVKREPLPEDWMFRPKRNP